MKESAMTYQYIVDPRLVVDILEGDAEWGVRSARLMDRHRNSRLFIAIHQLAHPGASGPGSAFDSLYIGAFALLYDGIITRQGDLYRQYYPSLPVIEP